LVFALLPTRIDRRPLPEGQHFFHDLLAGALVALGACWIAGRVSRA
jgi:hypothetical protein